MTKPRETSKSVRTISTPPTVVDVARAAGVSPSTVSRALNDRAEVSAKTRARVREIAHEMGYVPLPGIASLVARRKTRRPQTYSATDLLPVDILTRQYPSTTAVRFEEIFNRLGGPLGYRYEHFNTLDGQYASAARLGRTLFARGYVGLVFLHILRDKEWFRDFPWQRFALVSLDPSFDLVPMSLVRASHFEDIRRCWLHLSGRGYTRIGAILPEGRRDRIEDIRRLGAFHQCQSEVATQNQPLLLTFAFEEAGLPQRIAEWIERERPDALIAWSAGHLEAVRAELGWLPESVVAIRGGERFPGMAQGECVYAEIVSTIDQRVRSASYGPLRHTVEHVVRSEWREIK